MAPRVPVHPEPLVDLKARYRAAIVDVLDHRTFLLTPVPAPSGRAQHVFDTEDGLRLIVSTERLLDGRVGVHLSASFHTQDISRGTTGAQLRQRIVMTWQAISGSTQQPELLCVTDGAIPHFFIERQH